MFQGVQPIKNTKKKCILEKVAKGLQNRERIFKNLSSL